MNFLVIVGLCASAITASKIIQVGSFVFPCSNIIFSLLTFPVTDVISEIWGSKEAKRTVWISFAAQVLFVLLVQGSVHLPGATSWGNQDAYQLILRAAHRRRQHGRLHHLANLGCDRLRQAEGADQRTLSLASQQCFDVQQSTVELGSVHHHRLLWLAARGAVDLRVDASRPSIRPSFIGAFAGSTMRSTARLAPTRPANRGRMAKS